MSSFKQLFLRLHANTATHGPLDTFVVGKIPEWLSGSLYRNGPGIFHVGNVRLRHLFDGFAVLHRFHMHEGKVTYTSRVLDTKTWEDSVKANRLVTSQFGTYSSPDPCKSVFARFVSFFRPMESELTDNVSVNIVEHGDRLYALTETCLMMRMDPEKLQKRNTEYLRRTIAVHLATAHPHFDSDGNMYNLATAFNPPHNYNIVKFPPASSADADATAQAQLVSSLQSSWYFSIGYNHSFGMTRDHFVILEQPITMSSLKFLTSKWRKAAAYDNFSKHPNQELIFRLIRRSDNNEVEIKYRAQTAFTFHFVNCYEDEGHLVVDFVGYSDLDIIDKLYLAELDKEALVKSDAKFRRYVLPLSVDIAKKGVNLVKLPYTSATATLRNDGTVFLTPDYIVEGGAPMELPRINYDRNGQKYRYVYGTNHYGPNRELIKLDLETKRAVTWRDKGYLHGEPVFVPSPGATREDDGVVLCVMLGLRHKARQDYLLVLDASTFEEMARALAPPGVKMSPTFHGSHVQSKV